MRTDAKLGVAIGGLLCLVVIAYLTFRPAPREGEVRLIVDGEADPAEMLEEPTHGPAPRDAVARRSPAREQADEPAGREARTEARPSDRDAGGAGATGRGVNWARLLESGTPLMSAGPARPDPNVSYMFTGNQGETAEAGDAVSRSSGAGTGSIADGPATAFVRPPAEAVAEIWTDEPPAAAYVEPQPQGYVDAPARPSEAEAGRSRVEPAVGRARTHTVQPGETLSAIAAAAYGSASYYPHIMRANPEVDPNRLRPGTVLQLPDPAGVRPETPAPSGDSALAPIDTTREYRVQENDSLYRISVKLYGRGDQIDAIYELNREAIGPNPDRLKLNMVLKLPEPPTAAGASARTTAQ